MTDQQIVTTDQNISTLPGATVILGQAWTLYKNRFVTFVGILAVAVLGGGILLGAGLATLFVVGGVIGIVVIGICVLLGIVIALWSQTAILYAVIKSEANIGVIESYRSAWHKILSYWWVALLTGFILMGGIILLIVPAVIFGVWFSLAVYVLFVEDERGMSALLKSKEYVRGHWGSVFGRQLFVSIVYLVIYLVPGFIIGLAVPTQTQQIIQIVIGQLLAPLFIAYQFFLYTNLKALSGGAVTTPTKGRGAFGATAVLGALIVPGLIFFAITISSVSVAREKARDASRGADIAALRVHLELYYLDNSSYPPSLNDLTPKYVQSTPVDPISSQPYDYQLRSSGADYRLCFQSELPQKKDTCVDAKS